MSHVDDGTLHALVDDALDATARSAVEAHLASCGECARRFDEATTMTRQIATLLGTLDEPAPRVRVEPAATVLPTRDASAVQRVSRRGMFTLRRVALAASVLLVAGVSYEVGKTREGTPASESAAPSARFRGTAAPVRAMPSVVENVADSFVAVATPLVRQPPRGGPRSEAEVAVMDRSDAAASTGSVAPGSAARSTPVAAMQASGPVIGPEQAASASPAGVVAKSQGQSQSQSQSGSTSQAQAPTPAQAVAQAVAPPVPSTDVAIDTAAQRRVATAREADEALTRVQAQERERKGAPSATPSRIRVPRELTLDRVIVTGSSRAEESRNAAAPAKAPAPKVVALAGYSMTEDSVVAPTTRRRYFSPTGTALELLITSSPAARKESAGQRNAAEFVVTTANGRSTVRWHARGLDYVLEGALTPDSLMKLATQLKP